MAAIAVRRPRARTNVPPCRRRAAASRKQQRGFLLLSMLLARWAAKPKPFTVYDLFRNGEQGLHFEAYDPTKLGIVRRNFATNTGFSRGSVGATPTDYIERGLVTGRVTVDATTSSGFCMRVTSGGGTVAATDDVRLVLALSAGIPHVVRGKIKSAPGNAATNASLFLSGGAVQFVPITAAYTQFSFNWTPASSTPNFFFGGASGAAYDVSEVEVVRAAEAALPYQPITDWNTEYLAAVLEKVGMFQDSAGAIPVTGVEQPVGLLLDAKFGRQWLRGAELSAGKNLSGWQDTNAGVTHTNGSVTTTTTATGIVLPVALKIGAWFEVVTSGSTDGGDSNFSINTTDALVPTVRTEIRTGVGRCIFRADRPYLYIRHAVAATTTIGSMSVREVTGAQVHALQSTGSARMTLSARYNLLTKTQEFEDAAWVKTSTTVTPNAIAAPDGTYTADLLTSGTSGNDVIGQPLSIGGGVHFRLCLKRGNHDWVRIQVSTQDGSTTGFRSYVNLATGDVASSASIGTGTFGECTLRDIGGGWCEAVITGIVPNGSTVYAFTMTSSAGAPSTRVDNGTRYQWGADLRTSDDAAKAIPPYQRVNTPTDYDTEGFPHYFRLDGQDDGLATGNLDLTAFDKVTVWAGVTKLSDAAVGVVVEFSNNSTSNAGSFMLTAPSSAGSATYLWRSKGVSDVQTSVGNVAAPDSAVITARGDISGRVSQIGRNGVDNAVNPGDQGGGTYGNYPLNICKRGGTTLPFNGRLYSLTVRASSTPASDKFIKAMNRYAASLMAIAI